MCRADRALAWTGIVLLVAMCALPACATIARPTLEGLRGATIGSLPGGPISLSDGVYEASRHRVVLWPRPVAFGELAGVTGEVAVGLLSVSEGGSGSLVHVGVFQERGGRVADVATAPVGDRVQVRALGIVEGTVVLAVVEAGPGDALCCPGQLAQKSYAFRDGVLTLVSSSVTGRLSLAAVAGGAWTLVSLDRQPLPAEARSPTIVFDEARVSGFGGCNRYFGGVSEKAPGALVIGPLAATKMACPSPAMEIEDRFFAVLSRVTRYSFVGGRLVLSAVDGGLPRELAFERGGR
jgi:heat shock protein HslJ